MTLPDAVVLAVAHLDPEDGAMSPGHKVDAADLAALRTVLAHVAATDRPRAELSCVSAQTQVAAPVRPRVRGQVAAPFAARFGFSGSLEAR